VLKGFKERPYLKKEIEIYKSTFSYAIQGNINLYKLFCEKAHVLLKENGVFCFIMPMSIISDGSSSKLRNLWLTRNRIVSVSIYPEKEKIFENVTQALAIIIFLKSGETSTFNVILNTAEKKQISCLSLDIIRTIDEQQCPILFLSKNELSILKKIGSSNRLFSEFIRSYEGECHQTFHKAFFKDHDTGSLLVRGINVNKWQVDLSMDNKRQRWIDKRGFLKNKGSSDTARHYLEKRIVQQGIANMGQEVRLKATILQPEVFCGNSVNYFLINGEYKKSIDIKFILALLNSRLLNWRFKITSSNNNINCYEIHRLAFPNIKNLTEDQKPFVDIVDKILTITKDSEYLQNSTKQAKVKEYERQIDQMVYELYGLAKEEIKIVEGSDKGD
jgi:Alw26I/Eco31I/Esp3I family type II restriction m6 adenine DNA methyltransferase